MFEWNVKRENVAYTWQSFTGYPRFELETTKTSLNWTRDYEFQLRT